MKQNPVIGIDLGVTARSQIAVADGATIESSRSAASTPKGLTEGIAKAAAGREVAIVVESTAMAWFVAAVAALRAGVTHTLYRVRGPLLFQFGGHNLFEHFLNGQLAVLGSLGAPVGRSISQLAVVKLTASVAAYFSADRRRRPADLPPDHPHR